MCDANQDIEVEMLLYAPESYFQNFVITIYQRMNFKSSEMWLLPNEMLQQIKGKDKTLYELIEQHFTLHKIWYADFNNEHKHSQAESN